MGLRLRGAISLAKKKPPNGTASFLLHGAGKGREKRTPLQEGRENKRVCVLSDLLASVESEGFARAVRRHIACQEQDSVGDFSRVGSAGHGAAAHGVASTLKTNDEIDWRFHRGVDNRGNAFESR